MVDMLLADAGALRTACCKKAHKLYSSKDAMKIRPKIRANGISLSLSNTDTLRCCCFKVLSRCYFREPDGVFGSYQQF